MCLRTRKDGAVDMNIPDIAANCGLIVSLLAFAVSVVTEATKGIPFLKKIPTQFQVLVLSVAFSVASYIGYSLYMGKEITFYYILGSFFGGFVVSLVAQGGWSSVTELYGRVSSRKRDDK